jgi:hypothetical protein
VCHWVHRCDFLTFETFRRFDEGTLKLLGLIKIRGASAVTIQLSDRTRLAVGALKGISYHYE